MTRRKQRRSVGGFTLIELLIAFLIVGLLAAGMLPALASISKQSFHSEIAFSAPSVGQVTLNYTSTQTVYQGVLNPTVSWTEPATGLWVYSASVTEGGYKYALDTAVSFVGIGGGALLSTSTTPGAGQTTPTTVVTPSGDTEPRLDTKRVLAWGTCYGDSNKNDQTNAADLWFVGNGYLEVRPGSDLVINFALQVTLEDLPTASNNIKVEVPVNSIDRLGLDKKDPMYSFVDVLFAPTEASLPGQPTGTAVPASCDWQGRGRAVYDANDKKNQLLPPTSTTSTVSSGVGITYYWPTPWSSTPTPPIATYSFVPPEELKDKKAFWNIVLTLRFTESSASNNRWARIYLPTISGQGTTSTAFETYKLSLQFTPPTNTATFTWLAWHSITATIGGNTEVTLSVWMPGTSTYPFTFFNSSTGTMLLTAPLQPLGFPKDTLYMDFLIESIDKSKPAWISDVSVNYWYK